MDPAFDAAATRPSTDRATPVRLSESDRAILEQLRRDARIPTAELARRVGLARSTVQTKIGRMVDIGVIDGFSIVAGDALREPEVSALVMIATAPRFAAERAERLVRCPGVRSLASISGSYSFVAEVAAPTPSALDQCIDAIAGVDGVERTESHIVLSRRSGTSVPAQAR